MIHKHMSCFLSFYRIRVNAFEDIIHWTIAPALNPAMVHSISMPLFFSIYRVTVNVFEDVTVGALLTSTGTLSRQSSCKVAAK